MVALRKTIKNEFSTAFKQVVWEIPDEMVHHLEQLSPLVSEVVYFAAREAIRNAARHGRVGDKPPTLKITANQGAQEWEIIIEDTCIRNSEAQKKEPSSGKGLTLHGTLMAVIGGELPFEQVPGKITRVILRVPLETIDFSGAALGLG